MEKTRKVVMRKRDEEGRYYTPDHIILRAVEIMTALFFCGDYEERPRSYFDPSAGDGRMWDALSTRVKGVEVLQTDLFPNEEKGVGQADALTEYRSVADARDVGLSRPVLMGFNPPYGYKSSLAIYFANLAIRLADCVAFLVPVVVTETLNEHFTEMHYEVFRDVIFQREDDGKPIRITVCLYVGRRSTPDELRAKFEERQAIAANDARVVRMLLDTMRYNDYRNNLDRVVLLIKRVGGTTLRTFIIRTSDGQFQLLRFDEDGAEAESSGMVADTPFEFAEHGATVRHGSNNWSLLVAKPDLDMGINWRHVAETMARLPRPRKATDSHQKSADAVQTHNLLAQALDVVAPGWGAAE